MNTHEQINEMLVDYVLGELSHQQLSEVETHVAECRQCSGEVKRLEALLECTEQMRELSADEQMCESAKKALFETIVTEQQKEPTPRPKVGRAIMWRIIMKSKITKLAAAAVIIIAVLISISHFGGPLAVTSVAFGDVLKNIQDAKTLAWRMTVTTKGQEPQTMRIMVIEPYYMRCELSNGTVWILDHSQGKTLVLDPGRKLAVISSTAQATLDTYHTFRNFQNMEGVSVEQIGQQQVNGKLATGFYLKRGDEDGEITVWADPESKLPIRIETVLKDAEGNVSKGVTEDIVFDCKLDESLFSIKPPSEYKQQEIEGPVERHRALSNRSQSLTHMSQILKASLDYTEEHGGQWPDTLNDLAGYGIDTEILINPSQSERENGYVYLKPHGRLSPSQIVLYEACDEWNVGINVGFADGHVEFIRKESDFKKLLLK